MLRQILCLRRFARPLPALALVLSTLPLHALGTESPGVHSHGAARLQLAVEGNRMDLYLVSPAENLLGFEHRARTDEQKRRLEAASDWLGGQPLVRPEGGRCSVTQAAVAHDQTPEEHAHGHDHNHEHAGETAQDNAAHRDIRVDQSIECDGTIAGRDLAVALFGAFDGFQTITVEWVTGTAQGSARLGSAEDRFRVSE